MKASDQTDKPLPVAKAVDADATESAGERYWRSLDDLADTPDFQEMLAREFPSSAPDVLDPASRRTFLKLMAASVAMAGLTACRYPQQEILPFATRPHGRIPGGKNEYATSWEIGGYARGLLVTSVDGRPVKVDGNPSHPFSLGAADATTQASILSLYDPDRSRAPIDRRGGGESESTWEEFESFMGERLGATAGRRIAVLAEASSSPSLRAARQRLEARYPGLGWYEWEAVSFDAEREGTRRAFGRPLAPIYDLGKADLVVTFDADLLLGHPGSLAHSKGFAKKRRPERKVMSRVVAVESVLSVTGSVADERHALKPTDVSRAAIALAAKIVGGRGGHEEGGLSFVDDLAAELKQHAGHAVVAAGLGQPPEVHAACQLINHALGNVGRTVSFAEDRDPSRPSHAEAIARFASRASRGELDTVIVLGGNPAYDAPADLDMAGALANVETLVHLSEYDDETSKLSTWHLPKAHFLESWGDVVAADGTYGVVQPLIAPLFEGRTSLELIDALGAGSFSPGYDLVRDSVRGRSAGDFDAAWRTLLHDGLDDASGRARASVSPVVGSSAVLSWSPPSVDGELELVFLADPRTHDGRFANNGWLQETPEPITKLSWDNALLVGKSTADAMGLGSHRMATVTVGGSSCDIPVFVSPGLADGTAAVWLGHGRTSAGRVGDGLGVDAYPLRKTSAMHVAGASAASTGAKYPLATQQDHFAIDTLGMKETLRRLPVLVREATLDEYEHHPDFVDHRGHFPHDVDLWEPHKYDDYKWGMTVDLNTCTGCSACIVACQSENNIPIVGKEEVINGREMHWIRVDRYYRGAPDNPTVAFQPVTCHHCENAPCEQVCPVAATVHSREGLNQMVYNRCIGTRYCSNNCPYKVRRFNFFNNHKNRTELESMVFNPQVTVRSRGVMEKCSFCVQRIEEARDQAKSEGRRVADGDVTPACAQSCPTDAIVFGDLNDPESRVAKLSQENRSYAMLQELKVRPRLRYLAKIRNSASEGASDGSHQEHA